jgi:hypothetical protein
MTSSTIRVRRALLATAAAVVAAPLVLPTACAELPDIEQNTCGNSIVEAGEDCDSFTASGLSCRAAGGAGECRWDCTAGEDGARPACPDGWGCGADGICRAHTGAFAQAGEPIAALALDGADFDGDGRLDLVTFDGNELQIRFYETDGSLAKSYGFSATAFPPPSFGDLSGDGRSDAVIHLGQVGLGALTSTADRTMKPVVQSSIEVPLPTDGSRLIAANVLDNPGDETLAILSAGPTGFAVLALNQDENDGEATHLFNLPAGSKALDLIGEIPSGDFDDDPDKPCPELAFGFVNDDRVRVYTPCSDAFTYATGIAPRVVHLPAGHVIAGAIFIADANADGHLDVLIPVVTAESGAGLDVAFGLGDGSFHSDPTALPVPGPGDDAATLVTTLYGGPSGSSVGAGPEGGEPVESNQALLLAVGDLNGDDRVDLVTGSEVHLSTAGPSAMPVYEAQSLELTNPWTVAAVADFNGNGHLDIIGGSVFVTGLDFLNGTGDGKFNPFDLSTQRPVHRLAVGDFDGDLLLDLAFAETAGSDGLDTLAFAFGQPFGPPEDPVSAGTLLGIQQIVAGDRLLKFLLGGGASDAMSELAIVSVSEKGESGSLTVVPGSSDRRLQSPYVLFENVQSAPSAPFVTAIGQFTAGDRFADLVAIAVAIDTLETGAWLVTSEGEGKFGQAIKRKLEQDVGYFNSWFVVGDLDGTSTSDGLDEIVLVASWYDEATQGLVAVLRPDGAGSFSPPEIVHIAPAVGSVFPLAAAARLADLDGDGYKDLIVRATPDVYGGDQEVGDAAGVELYVFWNEAGQLALDAPVPLPALEKAFLGSFATLNVDADRQDEIVAVGDLGSWIVGAGPDRTFTVSELPGVPGGAMVIGGDFNGDGIDDLAVGDFQTTASTLLFGVAVRP